MKITFEEKEDKIYRLNELEVGDIFIKYGFDKYDGTVFMKIRNGIAVRLNDGHEICFTDNWLTFQKVEVELIVRGHFDDV